MKKIVSILLVLVGVPFGALANDIYTEYSATFETRVSGYFNEKYDEDNFVVDVRADVRAEAQLSESAIAVGELRVVGDTANIHQGTILDNRDGAKTIMSIREMYVELAPETSLEGLNIAIGKKIMKNAVEFDFAEFNPLARRDQSEPFSVMDDHTQDGVLMAAVEMQLSADANIFGQCVVAGRNNPVIATEPNDHWSRDLPAGLSYGDPDAADVNYFCRMWQERDSGGLIEVAVFHGSGSGVDHVKAHGTKVNPVFVQETAVSAAAEFTLGEFVTRLGCNAHFQEGSDDFTTCIAEVDRIWQFDSGATLFVEMGYVNSFITDETDVSMSDLDMRRALDNHLVGTVEYSPTDGLLFRGSGAASLERDDYYFRIEAEAMLDQLFPSLEGGVLQSTILTVRAEHINGEEGSNNIFDAHDDDDRIMIIFRKEF